MMLYFVWFLKQKLSRILPNFEFFFSIAITSLVITYYDVCQLCILYQCSPVLLRIHSAPNLEQLYCKNTAGSKALTIEREHVSQPQLLFSSSLSRPVADVWLAQAA